jgi:hypothetical protein
MKTIETANNAEEEIAKTENCQTRSSEDHENIALIAGEKIERLCKRRFVIDSGGSHHMVKNKKGMVNLKQVSQSVLVAKWQKMLVTHKGNLPVISKVNGKDIRVILEKVLIVPN